MKSRPLREVGAEQACLFSDEHHNHLHKQYQLLLDLQEIRAALLKLPGDSPATRSDSDPTYSGVNRVDPPHSFSKTVTKTTTRLETLLKAIIPPAVSAT